MFRVAIIIAIFFSTAAAAAVKTQQLSPNQSANAAGTPSAEAFNQLSMGPDPGGKTGATVTPETTKTGQPSVDGAAAASTQSGTSGTAASEVPKGSTDPSTGPSSRADALKQQRGSAETQPTGTGSTSPSPPGQGR